MGLGWMRTTATAVRVVRIPPAVACGWSTWTVPPTPTPTPISAPCPPNNIGWRARTRGRTPSAMPMPIFRRTSARRRREIDAGQAHRPRCRGVQSVDEIQQRRLSRAASAEYDDEGSLVDAKVDPVQGLDGRLPHREVTAHVIKVDARAFRTDSRVHRQTVRLAHDRLSSTVRCQSPI